MKRVTGIGGIFFKSEDPKKLRAWYGRHLGLPVTDWGSTFLWIDPDPLSITNGGLIKFPSRGTETFSLFPSSTS